jgi:hypothetical protein
MMFALLAVPAIVSPGQPRSRINIGLFSAGALFVLLIGFRYQVGGDWVNYLRHFALARYSTFSEAITASDPGYALLNWWAANNGFDVFAVNMICGLIFMIGLVAFARRQPYPWLALAVAFPYLIMVVGMGYTRQGVSIGLILLSLNALAQREFFRYVLFIAIATLFHRSALIMIPLGFMLFSKGWFSRSLLIAIVAYVLWDALVAEEVEGMWNSYVEAKMISQGAQIRVLMNLVPSLILLAYYKSWRKSFPDYWFWFWIAVGSVLAVGLVDIASTAVDRVALYFLPIQLVVFARLPYLLRNGVEPGFVKVGIVTGYAIVLYVWLNYASHAYAWLPYKNYLFM